MKIALLQCNPLTGDIRGNMEMLVQAALHAKEAGADLCVAPEMVLCGRNIGDMLLTSGFTQQCRAVLDAAAEGLAAHEDMPPLVMGAPVVNPVPQGKKLQNCAVLLHEGVVRVLGRKVLLPAEGVLNDTRYFEPGVSCGVLYIKGRRFAVAIGEDVWNDRSFWQDRRKFAADPIADFIAAGGADGIINLTAIPYEQGMPQLHERMLAHLAAHYRVPVAMVNMVGGNDSLVFYGGSCAFDGNGALISRSPFFEQDVLMVEMGSREKTHASATLDPLEELWGAVVTGTRDFIHKCGFTKVVLGLSGGIDSALVAAIAAEAFGPENVTALLMPSPYSSTGSVDDAGELAANLGIQSHQVPISNVLQEYERTFAAVFPGGLAGIAEENTQSRIRSTLLMAYANKFGCLLLATGNKSEAAVGYCTLYGDAAGALAPIGDLYKHQVYALCRWINDRNAGTIPEAILAKEPSAELAPGQKDSDSLPAYEVLDPILYDLIEEGQNYDELVGKGYEPSVVERIIRLVQGAEFKRHQAPPALHLSKCGFAGSLRVPVAAAKFSVPEA